MRFYLALAVTVILAQPAQAADAETSSAAKAEKPGKNSAKRAKSRKSDWRLYLSTGATYSSGDYGRAIRTNSLSVPLTARAAKGPLSLSASIPWLRITGARSVIPGDDDIVENPGGDTAKETRSGWGDVNLRARYRVAPKSWKGFELGLTGRVKLPTASERKRLGTGEADFGVGAQLSYARGKIQPLAEVQYRINGDPPGRDYKNTFATSLGARIDLGRSSATVSYDFNESRVRGRDGSHSLAGSISAPVAKRLTIRTSGEIGLSRNAPDYRLGAALTFRAF